jgi:type II secretory ATPase GspE/PulE/Tfp pilus assembly ATPase PilB-like protein
MEQLGLRGEAPKKRVYKPGGCDECLGSGYFGRTGVFEVIRINEPLRAMLSTHQRQEVLEQACREQEMLSIQQAGAEKVLAGETSAEEIIRKIMMDI